jgi:hypothetical protein
MSFHYKIMTMKKPLRQKPLQCVETQQKIFFRHVDIIQTS